MTEPFLQAVAASLADTTANLDAYIDRYAQEQAAERVAEAQAAANEAVREAGAEVQRQTDLVDELRRRLAALEPRQQEAAAARDRIAVALGYSPGPHPLMALAAEVERRLAEQDATIDRLRGEVRERVRRTVMADIPLPEMEP